ncbi:MAG: DUF881 domain-containing protein [Eubacteriales bacterium]|nr:DUF881 domain-containing protein [Eubacteriales bacterium]MDQ7788777.1 DUF881 domain-containing protein [Clostridia bacterium]MDZ4044017.1 DUF881 domain-containing protein [Eubacteriales bacterium]MDZ7610879.1 DUF881 domain-containing protein [Eubacteriales bacterium]
MTGKKSYVALVVVGLLLGLMLSMQFRVTRENTANMSVERVRQLASEVEQTALKRDTLRDRIDELRKELDEIAALARHDRLRGELELVRMRAGLLPVTGPGIEVTLNDSALPLQPGQNPNWYILHDEDLLMVLNELKAAGAEAVAINGERLVSTSEVRCIGPAVLVNKTKRLSPPYVITAVGYSETMISALKMRGGVLDTLEYRNIQFSVKKLNKVVLPAYTGPTGWRYAQRVGEGVTH